MSEIIIYTTQDNKTKICQTCGVNQAIEDFITYNNTNKEQE